MTRTEKTKNVTLKHTLSLKTSLTEREIALGSTHNKIQLIHLIAKYIIFKNVKAWNCRELFFTSADEAKALVRKGIQTKKIGMHATHEEAEIIVI